VAHAVLHSADAKRHHRQRLRGGRAGRLVDREGNLIPLINIIFLLLLYFMVAGSLARDPDAAIAPPKSASSLAAPVKVPVIALDADGALRYGGLRLDLAGLATEMKRGARAPRRVIVRADAAVDATALADVLAVLARSGVADVSLATVPRARSGGGAAP
jgi:biopolymer transport protein ExbD